MRRSRALTAGPICLAPTRLQRKEAAITEMLESRLQLQAVGSLVHHPSLPPSPSPFLGVSMMTYLLRPFASPAGASLTETPARRAVNGWRGTLVGGSGSERRSSAAACFAWCCQNVSVGCKLILTWYVLRAGAYLKQLQPSSTKGNRARGGGVDGDKRETLRRVLIGLHLPISVSWRGWVTLKEGRRALLTHLIWTHGQGSIFPFQALP